MMSTYHRPTRDVVKIGGMGLDTDCLERILTSVNKTLLSLSILVNLVRILKFMK